MNSVVVGQVLQLQAHYLWYYRVMSVGSPVTGHEFQSATFVLVAYLL